MTALVAFVVFLQASPLVQFRPYAWEALGRQSRMRAIVAALSSLPGRPGPYARLHVRSRFEGSGVVVRVNRDSAKGTMLLLRKYPLLTAAGPPGDPRRNAYATAAAAFFAAASESLSDADRRWTSFSIDVGPGGESGWLNARISRPRGGLRFGLSRLVVFKPGDPAPLVLTNHLE